MNAHTGRKNPATIALLAGGLVALGIAVLLGVAAASSYDVATIAALSRWSDFLLYLGATALVGSIILTGVRWLFATPAAPQAANLDEAWKSDHTKA